MARGKEYQFASDGKDGPRQMMTINEIQKLIPGRSWDWIKRGLDVGAQTVEQLSMEAAKRQYKGARLSLKLSRQSEGRKRLW